MSDQQFKIGDAVTYQKWDGEEGRGYGWFLDTKKAKIVSIVYKLDNGDMIEEAKLSKIPQSKSEPPKTKENGSSS